MIPRLLLARSRHPRLTGQIATWFPARCYKLRMDKFVVHTVDPNVEIRVTRAMPALSADLERRIDTLWDQAAERVEAGGAGRLFNGLVFSIDSFAPDRVTGHLTEYRRVIAQVEDHALFAHLGIRSLAACGVLRCSDGIAIGRRPAGAVYQPGMWQLCPAGSVDVGAWRPDEAGTQPIVTGRMDYRAALLTELREELGLEAEIVTGIVPLCVVEHPGSHVCDFGMSLETAIDGDALLTAHRSGGNGEYDPLRIVPIGELPAFVHWAGASLVPPAPVFLARAGWLPQGFSPPTGP
jgi:hypothetical protein